MSHQDIEVALGTIRNFFLEAQQHIDTMKVGDKVPATKLAEQIAQHHEMTGPQLYPVLKFFFDVCSDLNVKRGAHGGLFKVAPPSTTATAPEAVADVATSEAPTV